MYIIKNANKTNEDMFWHYQIFTTLNYYKYNDNGIFREKIAKELEITMKYLPFSY